MPLHAAQIRLLSNGRGEPVVRDRGTLQQEVRVVVVVSKPEPQTPPGLRRTLLFAAGAATAVFSGQFAPPHASLSMIEADDEQLERGRGEVPLTRNRFPPASGMRNASQMVSAGGEPLYSALAIRYQPWAGITSAGSTLTLYVELTASLSCTDSPASESAESVGLNSSMNSSSAGRLTWSPPTWTWEMTR